MSPKLRVSKVSRKAGFHNLFIKIPPSQDGVTFRHNYVSRILSVNRSALPRISGRMVNILYCWTNTPVSVLLPTPPVPSPPPKETHTHTLGPSYATVSSSLESTSFPLLLCPFLLFGNPWSLPPPPPPPPPPLTSPIKKKKKIL